MVAPLGALDHICYRVGSLEDYETQKVFLSQHGRLLSEAFVNGRPIATYKLNTPIKINEQFSIDVFELPAPKPGRPYTEGFEHIEMVTKVPLETIIASNGHLSFNCDNISAPINPDISLKFECGTIKFHESSLEKVIEVEQKTIALRASKNIVLFDFDDTLVDSKKQFMQASHRALQEFLGVKLTMEECIAKARPTFPEFFANLGIHSQNDIQKVIELFQTSWTEFSSSVQIPVGIPSIVSCLHSEGVQVVVWTAREQLTTAQFLAQTPMNSAISYIFAYDGVEPGKPVPPKELVALCEGAKVLLVGDSDSDQLGATHLGCEFYQAAWVTKKNLDIEKGCICDTPFDVLNKAVKYFSIT